MKIVYVCRRCFHKQGNNRRENNILEFPENVAKWNEIVYFKILLKNNMLNGNTS